MGGVVFNLSNELSNSNYKKLIVLDDFVQKSGHCRQVLDSFLNRYTGRS